MILLDRNQISYYLVQAFLLLSFAYSSPLAQQQQVKVETKLPDKVPAGSESI